MSAHGGRGGSGVGQSGNGGGGGGGAVLLTYHRLVSGGTAPAGRCFVTGGAAGTGGIGSPAAGSAGNVYIAQVWEGHTVS